MQIRDVVEISGINGRVPVGLIEASYRASQEVLVALILRGVSPQSVNRILDPIVPTLPLDIPGVLYIDADDHARVREAVLSAATVFVATATFRRLVRALGVAPTTIVPVGRAGRPRRGLPGGADENCAVDRGQPADQNGLPGPALSLISSKPQPVQPGARRYHVL